MYESLVGWLKYPDAATTRSYAAWILGLKEKKKQLEIQDKADQKEFWDNMNGNISNVKSETVKEIINVRKISRIWENQMLDKSKKQSMKNY